MGFKKYISHTWKASAIRTSSVSALDFKCVRTVRTNVTPLPCLQVCRSSRTVPHSACPTEANHLFKTYVLKYSYIDTAISNQLAYLSPYSCYRGHIHFTFSNFSENILPLLWLFHSKEQLLYEQSVELQRLVSYSDQQIGYSDRSFHDHSRFVERMPEY
jgi:hypothetical protein